VRNRWWAVGAFVAAALVLGLGLVLQNQANFSRDYVDSELAAHGITFSPVDALMPSQKAVPCLVANAGKPLTTGKQAECYAKYQIGLDLAVVDNGKTYSQDHYTGYLSRVKAAAAVQAAPDAPATKALVEQSQQADRKADDLLAGEATRGLLLTGYGFSVIGDRLQLAATVCFVVAGLLVVAGAVLLVVSRRKHPPQAVPPAGASTEGEASLLA
jgi:hypothetical protein